MEFKKFQEEMDHRCMPNFEDPSGSGCHAKGRKKKKHAGSKKIDRHQRVKWRTNEYAPEGWQFKGDFGYEKFAPVVKGKIWTTQDLDAAAAKGKTINYRAGGKKNRRDYETTFTSPVEGVQINIDTEQKRKIRRVTKPTRTSSDSSSSNGGNDASSNSAIPKGHPDELDEPQTGIWAQDAFAHIVAP